MDGDPVVVGNREHQFKTATRSSLSCTPFRVLPGAVYYSLITHILVQRRGAESGTFEAASIGLAFFLKQISISMHWCVTFPLSSPLQIQVFRKQVRSSEGKKKTAKRLSMEGEKPFGIDKMDARRGVWIGPARFTF